MAVKTPSSETWRIQRTRPGASTPGLLGDYPPTQAAAAAAAAAAADPRSTYTVTPNPTPRPWPST